MNILVTKADGTKQPFSKKKIVKTCLRMGANLSDSESIANQIEKKIYNGIPTKKILQMIFARIRKYKPIIKHQIDLRRALSLINPAPDFEQFIQLLLREHGYQVTSNQIISGKCVEHEIDAIARKDDKTYIVEIKHHYKYHTPTSLDVSRISRAVFEDLTEGYEIGKNNLKIDSAMIVCNTKLSQHAKRYANCRGIFHIGWSSPDNNDLQTMIEQKKMYPLTFLKELTINDRKKLVKNGMILVKQLAEKTPNEVRYQTGISKEKLESLIKYAKEIVSLS